MVTIRESEMDFGPYKEEDVFYIEKSNLYNNLKPKVKIAEFILKRNNALIFVEAKSSVPNPNGEKPENFNIYIDKIVEKLNNSLDILVSAKLNILENDEVDNFIDLQELSNLEINFGLVVKSAESKHLIPVKRAIVKKVKF